MFAGLVQPVGPTIPLVEIQGKWIAAAVAGDMQLPDVTDQIREIQSHRELQRKTYLDSDRYILEMDYKIYSRQMGADMSAKLAGSS